MPKPSFLGQTLEDLNIGTFKNIAVVRTDTPLYTALGMFVEQRVSALPVVDDKGMTAVCNDTLVDFASMTKTSLIVFVCELIWCFSCRSCGGYILKIWCYSKLLLIFYHVFILHAQRCLYNFQMPRLTHTNVCLICPTVQNVQFTN